MDKNNRKYAYLTIDDGPSERTKAITDFLQKKSIVAVMFFIGNRIEPYWEEAIYALKQGMIIGNHSFSHPHFSEISCEAALAEIEQEEVLINKLYKEAGVVRPAKLFRFPYGDKGGKNQDKLQEYLRKSSFTSLITPGITYPWYFSTGLNQMVDVFWTYAFEEYRLADESNPVSADYLFSKMENENLPEGGSLKDRTSDEILLIHDLPFLNAKLANYFEVLIEKTLKLGIEFRPPQLAAGVHQA